MTRVTIKSRFNGPPDSGNGGEGRKLWSGSAVFDEDGNPCAIANATWIVLKTEQEDFKIAR